MNEEEGETPALALNRTARRKEHLTGHHQTRKDKYFLKMQAVAGVASNSDDNREVLD